MKSLIIAVSCFVTLNASAQTVTTVITSNTEKTSIEETVGPQKKLREEVLKGLVVTTSEKAVSLDWDEGIRRFSRIDDSQPANFDIQKMTIHNGTVVLMEVQIHGFLKYYPEDLELPFSCLVDLEKYEGETDFVSEYAYCEIDGGEELEYEN